jgi:hypothetical protein
MMPVSQKGLVMKTETTYWKAFCEGFWEGARNPWAIVIGLTSGIALAYSWGGKYE